MRTNITDQCCAESLNSSEFRLVTSLWPFSAVIVTFLLMIIINVATIVGNMIVIVAVTKIDSLKKMANNQAVISLAVADLLVGLLVMPCAIDSILVGRWRFGHIWGKLNAFGNFCFCISSIMHLALLSVDRYIAISRPLGYVSIVTKSRARIACFFLWMYSTFWALPPLFGVSSYECFIPYVGKCLKKDWVQTQLALAFTVAVVCGTYGSAVVVMFYVYTKIFIAIYKQSRTIGVAMDVLRRNSLETARINSPAKKGVITVLIVIGTYMVCWSPFCILLFIQMSQGKEAGGPAADLVTMFIGFANSACNPIIYCIRHRAFREAAKALFLRHEFFKRIFRKQRPVQRSSSIRPRTTTLTSFLQLSEWSFECEIWSPFDLLVPSSYSEECALIAVPSRSF